MVSTAPIAVMDDVPIDLGPRMHIMSRRNRGTATDLRVAAARSLTGTYDAAQTNDDNANHWAAADALSARAATSPAVRRILRMRCRYEVGNSPLARGVLIRRANFVVGTGPRLQVTTRDRVYNAEVQRKFERWAIRIELAHKLWLMNFNRALSGEVLGIFHANLALRDPVKLDMRLVEADQLSDPLIDVVAADNGSDGVIFDDYGNRAGYRILKAHPGDAFIGLNIPLYGPDSFETFSAHDVIHYFAADRPGQCRGVPETTTSLPMFAMRRRYMLAVLAAAETAADIAGVIENYGPGIDPDNVEPLSAFELERRSLLALPDGRRMNQVKAEQPTTTIEMFDGVIVREIARCVNMPYGIASGDSSKFNFASAKIDHLPWFQEVRIQQDRLEDVAVDRVFERWFEMASLVPGHLPPPPSGSSTDVPPHSWFWDGQDLLDPRDAGAKLTGLKGGFESHPGIFARKGDDPLHAWEAQAEMFGMPLERYRELVAKQIFADAYRIEREAQLARAGNPSGSGDIQEDDE